MNLTEPQPTPYDLRFRLLGTNVRVHPLFWLVSVLLNFRLLQAGRIDLLVIWIVCVFVSILVHEFGHVMMGRVFGSNAHIILFSFGGLAVGSTRGLQRWQRVLVLFAGPGAGFVLFAVVLAGGLVVGTRSLPPILEMAFWDLVGINLFWGLINLLPVWPLDGGQISGEVLTAFSPRNGFRTALQISIVVASAIALLAFVQYMQPSLVPFPIPLGLYGAIMFALLAYGSYQLLQQTPRDPWQGDRYERTSWERDEWRR